MSTCCCANAGSVVTTTSRASRVRTISMDSSPRGYDAPTRTDITLSIPERSRPSSRPADARHTFRRHRVTRQVGDGQPRLAFDARVVLDPLEDVGEVLARDAVHFEHLERILI